MALTLRLVKGSRLTYAEADANFSGLADGSLWSTAALAAKTFTSLTLSGALTVGGALAANGGLTVSGGLTVGGGLTVSSGQFLAPDGSAAAPAYSFSGEPSLGAYRSAAGAFAIGVGGALRHQFSGTRYTMASSAGEISINGDVVLARDAANTLAQRNGTNAQVFNLYNTFTDTSNYERLSIGNFGNEHRIYAQISGTGISRTIAINSAATTAAISFRQGSSDRWIIASGGHLVGGTDNTYDIGASGANRPRDLFIGRNATLGSGASDSLTTNFGTWTLGSNIVATRNVGAAGAGTNNIWTGNISYSGDVGGSTDMRGWEWTVNATGANAINIQYGALVRSIHSGSALVGTMRAINASPDLSSTGNVSNVHSFYSEPVIRSTGSVTGAVIGFYSGRVIYVGAGTVAAQYGFYIPNLGHAQTTTAVGLQIEDFTGSTTMRGIRSLISAGAGKHNLYIDGTAVNYIAGQIQAGDGSAAAPAYSFANSPSTGLWHSTNNIIFTGGGTRVASAGSGGFFVDSNLFVVRNLAGSEAATLVADAANTLAQRNGANPQEFRLYREFTDALNYSRVVLKYGNAAGGNSLNIITEQAGTGGARNLGLGAANSVRWVVSTNGHFVAETDNTYDIGASGANRPRNLYLSAALVAKASSSIVKAASSNPVLTLQGNTTSDTTADLYIGRTGIATTAVGTGPNIQLYNDTSGKGLILQTSDSTVQFFTNNALGWAEQFRIAHAASAINYLQVEGAATASSPRLSAQGGDANVSMIVQSKGSGIIDFWTSGTMRQFRIGHTTSAVNYLQATGGTTGAPGQISAQGSDTNVGIDYIAKGSGYVSGSTTHRFLSDAGARVQFAVGYAALAVNYAQITGGASGGSPIFSALGSDTNVGINYMTKGSGQHAFETNGTTSNVQMVIVHTTSAVNYLQATGGATGSPGTVTLSAQGSDSNIDVQITPKGTGIVRAQGSAAVNVAGKQAIPISALAMSPRSSNGCASLATSNGAANQPDVHYLAFDGAAAEYAGFYMRMPKGWNEGTVTAAFSWRRASGTAAANVVWGIRGVAVSDNESPAATFGTGATVTDAASTTTANMNVSGETSACTIGGSPAEGDLVFFEVYRDGASGSDTLDGVDAWLTEVTLFITTNAPNDA